MDHLGTAVQEIQLVQKKESPNYSHHNMDMYFHRLLTFPAKLLCQEFPPKRPLIDCIVKNNSFALQNELLMYRIFNKMKNTNLTTSFHIRAI